MPRVLNNKRDGLPEGAVYAGRALRGHAHTAGTAAWHDGLGARRRGTERRTAGRQARGYDPSAGMK